MKLWVVRNRKILWILIFSLIMVSCEQRAEFSTLVKTPSTALNVNDPGVVGEGPDSNGGGISNEPCHNFTTVTEPLKILISIDNTGSTQMTDPNQQYRQRSVREFAGSVASMKNVSYNFQYFADARTVSSSVGGGPDVPLATSLIHNGGNQNPVFGDIDALTDALDKYAIVLPNGYTNYSAALNLIKRAIVEDPDFKTHPENQNYAILFMSDGQPTDAYGYPLQGTAADESLYQELDNLVGLSPNHISFSTVYFNAVTLEQALNNPSLLDAGAIPRLQQMAIRGRGQFANTLIEGIADANLARVITLPSSLCN